MSRKQRTPESIKLLAVGVLAASCWQVPQVAFAYDCGLDDFTDPDTDDSFLMHATGCVADKALDNGFGVLSNLAVDLAGAALNSFIPGVGTLVSGIFGDSKGNDSFGPYAVAIMQQTQVSTDLVIEKVNQDQNDNDTAFVNSLEQSYAPYLGITNFGKRVDLVPTEYGNNQNWWQALDLLSLDRHGPQAVHAYVMLAQVFARRMADLELGLSVRDTIAPSHPPASQTWDGYIAGATPGDWTFWANDAQQQSVIDFKFIFNGGTIPSNSYGGAIQLPGIFNDINDMANGGFRNYSDGRFSDVTDAAPSNTYQCYGTNAGATTIDYVPRYWMGTYEFPLDPTAQVPTTHSKQYKVYVDNAFLNTCPAPADNTYLSGTSHVEVRTADDVTLFTLDVPNAGWGDNPVTVGTLRLQGFGPGIMTAIKQRAYENYIMKNYASVRPVLDHWWKVVGNPGYSNNQADQDVDNLVMASPTVSNIALSIGIALGTASDEDRRNFINYALTYGAGGLEELLAGVMKDPLIAPQSATNPAPFAATLREYLSNNTDPGLASAHVVELAAAKIIAGGIH